MSNEHRRLMNYWLALVALGAIELAGAFIPFGRSYRPLLLLPALGMVALVAFMFMGVRSGPAIVRIFAIAGIFWLTILLGLGMMDPLTRALYPTLR